MKNLGKSILVIVMLFSITATHAQNDKREKMEALKVAFITEKLDLTTKEAKAFWPIYNEFNQKRMEASKGMGHGPEDDGPPHGDRPEMPDEPNFDKMTDAQIEAFIDERHQQEQQMLDLKIEYMIKYKKVLPIRKIAALMHVEKDFRKEILKKMRENSRK